MYYHGGRAAILITMLLDLRPSDLLVVFVTIILSMGVHEAMHAFVAHSLGDTTARDEGRLTLNPLKHVDLYMTVLLPIILILMRLPPFFVAKPVPFNPARVKYEEYGAAMIGIAGPLTNFVLAAVVALSLRLSGAGEDSTLYAYGSTFIVINLAFFIFNMIPFPPLDGSRVLYAFAPEPLQKIMYQIESAGFLTILIFMLLLFPFVAPIVSNSIEVLYRFLL